MELLHVFFTSTGSIIALFLLTKIMGKRQISQLSMFDYINGITIGSIAAEMATSLEDDFFKPLLAMVIYALAATLISYIGCKSIKLRKFLESEAVVLLESGKIYKENLKKAKLDLDEFLMQCRNEGYFDISEIEAAVLETNGQISFLPKSKNRPATPEDLSLDVSIEKINATVILDGVVLQDNLKHIGNNEEWLKKELKKQGISKVGDVFLATCNIDGQLNVFKDTGKEAKENIF